MGQNYISSRIWYAFFVIYFCAVSRRRCCLNLREIMSVSKCERVRYAIVTDLFPCDWRSLWLEILAENIFYMREMRTVSISQKIVYTSKHTHSRTVAQSPIHGRTHRTIIMRIDAAVELFSGKSTSSFYAFYLLDRLWNPMWHLINMYVSVLSLWMLFFPAACGGEWESKSAVTLCTYSTHHIAHSQQFRLFLLLLSFLLCHRFPIDAAIITTSRPREPKYIKCVRVCAMRAPNTKCIL